MSYSFRSVTGNVRENNEDFIAVPGEVNIAGATGYDTEKLGMLYVLCDGMGGANAGEVASEMAATILLKEYYSLRKKPEDPGFFITETLAEINRRIIRRGLKIPDCFGMGTTLVSLLDDGNDIFINSVGDSRVYRFRNKKLEQITEDQSVVWEYYKSGRMTKDQIRTCPGNNIITCALGTDPHLLLSSIESYRLGRQRSDTFLLCSDGLSDLVSDIEIEKIMAVGSQIENIADNLVNAALDNGGKDNISLIIVKTE